MPFFREKLSNLSEFVREIKVNFTRFFNRRHGRKGYFWGGRFKSVIVEKGETTINCLAYIDLNPVPPAWLKNRRTTDGAHLGYHVQTNNKGNFLSTDFGLKEFDVRSEKERVGMYWRYVYETGAIRPAHRQYAKSIEKKVITKERKPLAALGVSREGDVLHFLHKRQRKVTKQGRVHAAALGVRAGLRP